MPLLPRDMTLEEIMEYLQNDLKRSIGTDIDPVIEHGDGFFSVPRSVFSYIDYLGMLYTGDRRDQRGYRQTTRNAIQFIEDILGEIDPAYRTHASMLYKMYRHGTIHQFQPKDIWITKNGELYTWFVIKGPKSGAIHLQPIEGNRFPIDLERLVEDLRKAVDLYCERLDNNHTLVERFNQVRGVVLTPEEDP